jgi:hypothetical protein
MLPKSGGRRKRDDASLCVASLARAACVMFELVSGPHQLERRSQAGRPFNRVATQRGGSKVNLPLLSSARAAEPFCGSMAVKAKDPTGWGSQPCDMSTEWKDDWAGSTWPRRCNLHERRVRCSPCLEGNSPFFNLYARLHACAMGNLELTAPRQQARPLQGRSPFLSHTHAQRERGGRDSHARTHAPIHPRHQHARGRWVT